MDDEDADDEDVVDDLIDRGIASSSIGAER